MRLDKLRGYGPWFAFAVPFLFLLAVGFTVAVNVLAPSGSSAPGWFPIAVAVVVLLWALIALSGLVVAIDLEWIEHPRTNTTMTYVAFWGYVVALLGALLTVGFGGLLNEFMFAVGAFVAFAGFAVYLVVINMVGLRAGLLGGGLPWLGIVAGGFFLLAALLTAVGYGAASGFGFFPGWVLYLGWSLWLGFRLRGKAPEMVKAPA